MKKLVLLLCLLPVICFAKSVTITNGTPYIIMGMKYSHTVLKPGQTLVINDDQLSEYGSLVPDGSGDYYFELYCYFPERNEWNQNPLQIWINKDSGLHKQSINPFTCAGMTPDNKFISYYPVFTTGWGSITFAQNNP